MFPKKPDKTVEEIADEYDMSQDRVRELIESVARSADIEEERAKNAIFINPTYHRKVRISMIILTYLTTLIIPALFLMFSEYYGLSPLIQDIGIGVIISISLLVLIIWVLP